ncbi:unnamed protein product [Symbiodinium sp. CCMP2456]|nr:unnamed protein product [Symbiodinium sp. CCMP2456]
MPMCTCRLDGVAESWAADVRVVQRVHSDKAFIVAPGDEELKCSIKHVVYNDFMLKPLILKMADEPAWGLFSLGAVHAELKKLLASLQMKLDANAVKLGALWAKCLSSFIKMKDGDEVDGDDEPYAPGHLVPESPPDVVVHIAAPARDDMIHVAAPARDDMAMSADEDGSVLGDSMDGVPMEVSEEEFANELPALPTPVSGPVLPPSISTPSAEKIARLQRMEHLRSEIEKLSSKSRRKAKLRIARDQVGGYALDTDDTLIEVLESQQLCHAGGSQVLPTPSPTPLARRLFPEDHGVVDLNSPAPKPEAEIPVRPVARPLVALRAHLAENAAKKRAEKEAKRSKAESDEHEGSSNDKGSGCNDKGSHDNSGSSNDKGSSHDKGSHDGSKASKEYKGWDDEKGTFPAVLAGGDGEFLCRRQQLQLQPKAKGKAKAKSTVTKPSEPEAPANAAPALAAGSVKPSDKPAADSMDPEKAAVCRGRGRGKGRGRGRGRAGSKADDGDATSSPGGAGKSKGTGRGSGRAASQADGDAASPPEAGKSKGRGRGRGRAAIKADGDAVSSPRAGQSKRSTDKDEPTAVPEAEPAGMAEACEVDACNKRRKGEIGQVAKPKAAPKKSTPSVPQSLSVLSGSKMARQVSSCKKNMTPGDIMNLLQTDDLMMRIVMEQIEALGKPLASVPTKENQDTLPSYDWWKLSTYWTRYSVGVIRKGSGDVPDIYVGTFVGGGCESMAVALESLAQYVIWMGGDKAELRYPLDSDDSSSFRLMLNDCAKYAVILKSHMDETGLSLEDI